MEVDLTSVAPYAPEPAMGSKSEVRFSADMPDEALEAAEAAVSAGKAVLVVGVDAGRIFELRQAAGEEDTAPRQALVVTYDDLMELTSVAP